jgi:hypothetical protein
MSRRRCGPLAAWTGAWLAGACGADDVIAAVTGADAPHLVGGLAGFDPEPVGLAELLIAWRHGQRRGHSSVRLVAPVAGDVRGLPGPAAFRSAALEAGEAVCGPGVGVVAQVIDHFPSSAPTSVMCQAFAVEASPPDHQQLSEAQYDLTTAIRESATALSAADVAGWVDDVAADLHDARRAGEILNLPPDFPSRAVGLISQAERLQAVLDLAATDPTGGAIDRTGIAARAEGLRPLATAVRRARLAGYNALANGA